MKRRHFLRLFGGAAVALPLAVRAQQAGKIWRMGFIAHGHEKFYDALFKGLQELGYVEGQNLIVERRYAEGRAERFPEFAAEMVRLNVDVIVVVTTPAALAVKKATTTIPIVHPNAIDPLNTGLVASLAHPGGRMGDHATNIAEAVHYMVKGETLLRERPKADFTSMLTMAMGRTSQTPTPGCIENPSPNNLRITSPDAAR